MNCLFFDVETNGLPKEYSSDFSDIDNWPRVVQLAWGCSDSKKQPWDIKSYIIKPVDFDIPKETSDIHGITYEHAMEHGVEFKSVFKEFENDLRWCDCIVAHNLDFDLPTVNAEILRNNVTTSLLSKKRMCTMKTESIIKFCNLIRWGVYDELKWPKLVELHTTLFGVEFDGQHDAKADVAACMRCYYELCDRGIIKV